MASTREWFDSYKPSFSNREDLLDIITNISPTDTPVFSSISKGTASGTLHEWGEDTLAAAAPDKAHVEGDDPVYPAAVERLRPNNNTQILTNPFSVTRTQDKVAKAGISSEVAYQATKKMEEHKLDIEAAILNNAIAGSVGVSGTGAAAGTGRAMKPLEAYIDATHKVNKAAGALLEADINTGMEVAWNDGGKVDTIICSSKGKRKITSFLSASTGKTIEMTQNSERRNINRVDVYEGDFGVVRVIPNRALVAGVGSATATETHIYLLEMGRIQYDFLTPPMVEELARTGDSVNRWVYSEGCIVNKSKFAHYQIQNYDNAV